MTSRRRGRVVASSRRRGCSVHSTKRRSGRFRRFSCGVCAASRLRSRERRASRDAGASGAVVVDGERRGTCGTAARERGKAAFMAQDQPAPETRAPGHGPPGSEKSLTLDAVHASAAADASDDGERARHAWGHWGNAHRSWWGLNVTLQHCEAALREIKWRGGTPTFLRPTYREDEDDDITRLSNPITRPLPNWPREAFRRRARRHRPRGPRRRRRPGRPRPTRGRPSGPSPKARQP